ncbi:hypothetical protein D3C86_1643400 [compost metagenome]
MAGHYTYLFQLSVGTAQLADVKLSPGLGKLKKLPFFDHAILIGEHHFFHRTASVTRYIRFAGVLLRMFTIILHAREEAVPVLKHHLHDALTALRRKRSIVDLCHHFEYSVQKAVIDKRTLLRW